METYTEGDFSIGFNSGILFQIGLFQIIFFLMFFIMIGVFVFAFVTSIVQWNRNNHMPKITVNAKVVSRRTGTSSRSRSDDFSTRSTKYYVTFQLENGERIEFMMDGHAYGRLAEEDYGKLTFQGTRYLGFVIM